MELGKCRKVGDLDKKLHNFDFIVLVNHQAWQDLDDRQRVALLDHELAHCAVSVDDEGEVKQDENGRTVYRIRKHDLEEFRDVVQRNGLYKADLEAFAAVCAEKYKTPTLFEEPEHRNGKAVDDGEKVVTTADGRRITVDEMMGEVSKKFAGGR